MFLKRMARAALLAWGRWGRASGYRYQFLDQHGAKLADDGLLPARLPNGCRVRCDLRDHVQRQIWFDGVYEPIETYLFSQFLGPGMTVLDAGANVGQYSLIAATAVGRTGCVHSFEPIPATFARLADHVADNDLGPIIRLNQAALWEENKELRLALALDMLDNVGSYSIGTPAPAGTAVVARGVRLDEYAVTAGLERLDLIKMDIEGAEPFALSGGLESLKKFQPVILMEVNRSALLKLGSSPGSLWEIVGGLEYKAWLIGSTPDACGPIDNFDGLEQANVFLHHEPLPAAVIGGWTHRSVMRWARANL